MRYYRETPDRPPSSTSLGASLPAKWHLRFCFGETSLVFKYNAALQVDSKAPDIQSACVRSLAGEYKRREAKAAGRRGEGTPHSHPFVEKLYFYKLLRQNNLCMIYIYEAWYLLKCYM